MQELTYEQELVERAKRVSPDINDYFEEQRYKLFTDEVQQEEITDRYLVNVAIELLIAELKDMGIESDLTSSDILEDKLQLDAIFALRTKFDQQALHTMLTHLSEKTFSDFMAAYESVGLPEDLLLELGPWFADLFPSDDNWSVIGRCIETWYSTQTFANHLGTIIALMKTDDTTTSVVTDDNVDAIKAFLDDMRIRQERLLDLVTFVCRVYPDLSRAILDEKIASYDHQKLDGDNLPLFALYFQQKPKEEPDFLVHHHETVDHHVEYWLTKSARQREFGIPMPAFTHEIAVLIVLSMVLDGDDHAKMLENLKPLDDVLPEADVAFMRDLAGLDYENREISRQETRI